MADQAITALPKKTYSGSSQIASTDYLLGIDSAEGYQMLIQDLGEYIINRATASLAGSTQTLASAISALNSKLTPITGALTNSKIPLYITKIGNMIYVRALYVAPTAVITAGEWTEIGTLPTSITVSETNYIGGVFTSQTGETYGFRGSINANGKVGMVFEKTLNTNMSLFGVAVSVS